MSQNKDSITVEKYIKSGAESLKESGIEEYRLESRLFMMKATGFSKTELFTKNDYVLTEAEKEAFESTIKRRITGEPCQYILGKCEFFGYDFYVDKNVLIPRNDTEILIETVLKYAGEFGIKNMLDIGTGSGCIPITLALEGDIKMTSVDISEGALNVAKKNASLNNVSVEFIKSDVFSALKDRKFDSIVSNPPYIEREEINNLSTEVKDFEPLNALDGGIEGLDFYRRIIKEGKEHINENGFIFFEIGYNQGEDLKMLFEENGYKYIETVKDLAGLDRVVVGRL